MSEAIHPFRCRLVVLLALSCLFISCHSDDALRTETPIEFPPDFRISIGEGGGFTGLWIGHTVDSAGTVFAWRGAGAEEKQQKSGRLSRKEMGELWQILQRERFFELDVSGSGNMSAFLAVTANGKTHRVSCAKTASPDSVTMKVEHLYQLCRAKISQGS